MAVCARSPTAMTDTSDVSLNRVTQVRREDRQHAPPGLRQDDLAKRLRLAHSERERCFGLSLADRFDAGAERLGIVGGVVERERDQTGDERREGDAEHDRHHVERPVNHENDRQVAEQLDEAGGEERNRSEARLAQHRDDDAAGHRDRHRQNGQRDGDERAARERSGAGRNDGPIEVHDRPRNAMRL